MEWSDEDVCGVFDTLWEESGRDVAELFGDSEKLSDDEFEIVFNSALTHDEKRAKLRVLRAGKQVKPQSFAKRLTRAGRISARGLGIRLD